MKIFSVMKEVTLECRDKCVWEKVSFISSCLLSQFREQVCEPFGAAEKMLQCMHFKRGGWLHSF